MWATRFIAQILITNSCWLWTGPKLNSGYGVFYGPKCVDGTLTHRLLWEMVYGPIPPHMHICHTCDVRLCCNPDHLFLGTAKDNIHDMIRKGRWVARVKLNGSPSCHPDRPYYAKGQCQACYRNSWRDAHRERQSSEGNISPQPIFAPSVDGRPQPTADPSGDR